MFRFNKKLPAVDLLRLKAMTDYTGMLQHSTHAVPCFKEGYATDDNARALIAVLRFQRLFPERAAEAESLARTYLSFMHYTQTENGLFHNFVSFDKRFMEEQTSWDCFGRALWAAGFAVNSGLDENLKALAKKMIDDAMPNVITLQDCRPAALALMGIHHYFKAKPEQLDLLEKINALGNKLLSMLGQNSSAEWQWFEEILTYSNAIMPHALFLAFDSTKDEHFLHAAEQTYSFLRGKTIEGDMFVPVGQNGWLPRGGQKALFDQQPIEAGSMADAALTAFNLTGKREYAEDAFIAFNWFLGKNLLGKAVFDSSTGACFDGLTAQGPNLNQGAESTIAFLFARLAMEELMRSLSL